MIGRSLPTPFSEADVAFQRRVTAAFPLPMPEAALVSHLEIQGFSVSGPEAVFEKTRFPCTLSWRIKWDVSAGMVTAVNARYGGVCL